MKRGALLLALSVCATSAGAAADVPPPRWDISEVCQMTGDGGGPCPRVESDARRTLLDRWTALPADIRLSCSREVEAEQRPSYRKLSACINDLAFQAFEQQRQQKQMPPATATPAR